MSKHSPIQWMQRAPAALRAIAGAYVVLAALMAFDAVTATLTDPQVDPFHALGGTALGLAGVAAMLGIMWACTVVPVQYGPGPRARAVLRWFPILLLAVVAVPFAQAAVHTLSTLVITVTP
jgi:hypothetical protein